MTDYITAMKHALKKANPKDRGENRMPHRFFVVHDEEAIGRLLSLTLGAEGVEVSCLTEVTEETLSQLPGGLVAFHTALVDLHLGEMSGVQAAQLLLHENPDIRIVFMSGYPRESAPGDIDSIAGDTYLRKPVKPGHCSA
jgi:DNA-binding response OmpR family regulator